MLPKSLSHPHSFRTFRFLFAGKMKSTDSSLTGSLLPFCICFKKEGKTKEQIKQEQTHQNRDQRDGWQRGGAMEGGVKMVKENIAHNIVTRLHGDR